MGGVTGVGIFIGHFWDNSFAVSAVVYIANAILFIIGVIFLGKRFAVATAAGTVLYPTFLQLSSFLIERFNGGQSLAGDNVLLSVICGGLMFGGGESFCRRPRSGNRSPCSPYSYSINSA